jgi:hypothetical protein
VSLKGVLRESHPTAWVSVCVFQYHCYATAKKQFHSSNEYTRKYRKVAGRKFYLMRVVLNKSGLFFLPGLVVCFLGTCHYEELYKLRENLSFFGLESRECGSKDPLRWPRYPQKLALTSLSGGGRSVGIVRSRTQATSFFVLIATTDGMQAGELGFDS